MNNIYDLIIETFEEGMHIPLIGNGNFNIYIGISNTTVNGIFYPNAIHYRISEVSTKRITSLFIELTYDYYIEHNVFPGREWYAGNNQLQHEYITRGCNYAVVKGLINTVLNNN